MPRYGHIERKRIKAHKAAFCLVDGQTGRTLMRQVYDTRDPRSRERAYQAIALHAACLEMYLIENITKRKGRG